MILLLVYLLIFLNLVFLFNLFIYHFFLSLNILHDQNKGSYCIGYISRILAGFLAPLIDSGRSIQSIFKEIRGGYEPYMNYGIAMQITI